MSTINPSHILTQGGFIKESLNIINEKGEKIRLYRLPNLEQNTLEVAKQAIKAGQTEKERHYEGKISDFFENGKAHPYLLREGNTLKLLPKEEADKVFEKYGISGEKAVELSVTALELLKQHNIQTGQDLIQLYNKSDEKQRKTLLSLFSIILVIFEKHPIQTEEEVKTLTLFATCEDNAIRTAALDSMMHLFEASGFQNVNYGYGLKYLIDNLPPEFLNTNQLHLLTIFEKLTIQLDKLLHTERSVNHEIEPLMAALISIARATRNSEITGLAKGTKNNFYARMKKFYYSEEYTKRIMSLKKDKNYLLEFEAIWPLQHLIRIPSSEHKAVTFIRKAGHGLYAAGKLAGAPLAASLQLVNYGKLPDENIIPDLKTAYEHAEKTFGFKDIPRPWLDMLEHTEEALINPEATEETLESVYQVATQYDQMQHTFNEVVAHNLKKIIGKDKDEVSLQENKEFAFGFVGQLSDLAMDHPSKNVRHKAIEILEKVFSEKDQSKDVKVFILTTLQNIIDDRKNDTAGVEKAQTLKEELEKKEPSLQNAQLFRASKYPCLALKGDSPLLLEAAKQKLESISGGKEALPLSEFIFNPKIVTKHGKLLVEKDLNIMHMTADYAIKISQEAKAQHAAQQAKSGKIDARTRIESLTQFTVKGKTTVKGDMNIGFGQK